MQDMAGRGSLGTTILSGQETYEMTSSSASSFTYSGWMIATSVVTETIPKGVSVQGKIGGSEVIEKFTDHILTYRKLKRPIARWLDGCFQHHVPHIMIWQFAFIHLKSLFLHLNLKVLQDEYEFHDCRDSFLPHHMGQWVNGSTGLCQELLSGFSTAPESCPKSQLWRSKETINCCPPEV